MLSENSTTGRSELIVEPAQKQLPKSMPARGRALRTIVGTLSSVSPELAARLVTRIWFTPPRRVLGEADREELAAAEPLSIEVAGRRVAAWSFGSGPVVLLVHGWGGRAGQLLGFVRPLVDAGARAVVFDGLGHGASAASTLGRRQGSFVDVAACMQAITEKVGSPHAIVAHSGGAIATGIAMAGGMQTTKLALLAPMVQPLFYATQYEAMLGLSPEVVRRWRALAETRARFRWNDLDLLTAAERHSIPDTLVVHDRKDKEVPFTEGEALAAAWRGADLVATSGLGHQRLLQDAGVIRQVLQHVGT